MTEFPRIRVLLVSRNLPPLVGGMERLNWHMAAQLAQEAQVRIVAPSGSAALAPAEVAVEEVPLRPLWRFLAAAAWRAVAVARHWHPDVVVAGSGLSAPMALMAARCVGARCAAYVHGLDLAVRHPLYRRGWLPALRRMDRILANSRATARLAERIGVPSSHIGLVHPGVQWPALSNDVAGIERFRRKHALQDRPLLISVGRLSERKGMLQFVRDSLPKIVAQHPRVLLVIVGDIPGDALHAKAQTPAQILQAARQAGVAGHVRFLGVISDYAELGTAYRASSVHVFPVREVAGDPEGFGMVAVEAAAHGLATVAYATGGVVDAVREGVSGRLVTPGDAAGFADAVLAVLCQPLAAAPMLAFARGFEWAAFGESLRQQLAIPSRGVRPL